MAASRMLIPSSIISVETDSATSMRITFLAGPAVTRTRPLESATLTIYAVSSAAGS